VLPTRASVPQRQRQLLSGSLEQAAPASLGNVCFSFSITETVIALNRIFFIFIFDDLLLSSVLDILFSFHVLWKGFVEQAIFVETFCCRFHTSQFR
jgi:hypothetical protein